jgi:hypothetical protein
MPRPTLLALMTALSLLTSCRESQRKALTGDACAKIVVRFEDAFQQSPKICQTELDCTCFPSISNEIPACNGVADHKTIVQLQSIAQEFYGAGCRPTTECAKRECVAHCVRGHCQE